MVTTSSLEAALVQQWRNLPADRQVEVVDFVEFLTRRAYGNAVRRNPIGLFAELGSDITDLDLADARSEMWESFFHNPG